MTRMNAPAVLDREYLKLRCEILNLAAALDRIERSDKFADAQSDPRLIRLQQGIEILRSSGTDRAERVQMHFSDEYQPGWSQ